MALNELRGGSSVTNISRRPGAVAGSGSLDDLLASDKSSDSLPKVLARWHHPEFTLRNALSVVVQNGGSAVD
jgi:hypothetical protein